MSDKWQGQLTHSPTTHPIPPLPHHPQGQLYCTDQATLPAEGQSPHTCSHDPGTCFLPAAYGEGQGGGGQLSLTQTTEWQTGGRASSPMLLPLNQLILKPGPALLPVLPRHGVGPTLPRATVGLKSGASSVEPPDFNVAPGLGLEQDNRQ